jgi:hypothetical protein
MHAQGAGPLSVARAGGNSLDAPREVPWVATFGWSTPCTTTGEPITIDRVRYQFKVKPKAVRSVAFEAKRYRGVTGIGSAQGSPAQALRSGDYRGKILGPAGGLVVTDRCGESADQVLQILTVLKVGADGAEIPRYAIDYTTAGEKYTVEVDFHMVACGSKTSRDMCQPGPAA